MVDETVKGLQFTQTKEGQFFLIVMFNVAISYFILAPFYLYVLFPVLKTILPKRSIKFINKAISNIKKDRGSNNFGSFRIWSATLLANLSMSTLISFWYIKYYSIAGYPIDRLIRLSFYYTVYAFVFSVLINVVWFLIKKKINK